jgi:hypothetical protein
MDPGFEIQDLKENLSQIRIQRVKKTPDPGSETLLTDIGRIQYRTELSKYGSHLFHPWLCFFYQIPVYDTDNMFLPIASLPLLACLLLLAFLLLLASL